MTANIKSPQEVKMGDTITDARHPSPALPGFKEIHPMVFSGIYPINTGDYEHLKASLGKLQLNDSAFAYQPETSVALGFGFRCGFLGLLHLRLSRSACDANTAWTSSRPIPASSIALRSPTAR
jgi:GTP-binding protein LepA